MKAILILIISFVFSFCSFAQEDTETNGRNSFALTYQFTSHVTGDKETPDNTYTREVEVYRTAIREKIMKYDFFCINFEFEGPNNISYLRRVAYVFDEISILVNTNGKIIDVIKPVDMDKRWEETKEKILLSYKGEVIENYLKEIDQTIEDKEKLIAFIQSDAMYGLFLKAVSELEHPVRSSTISIKEKEGVKIITPKTRSTKETEQYTFKDTILNYAVKTVPNIQYEIKYLEPIKQ